jgi:hypothetical protein
MSNPTYYPTGARTPIPFLVARQNIDLHPEKPGPDGLSVLRPGANYLRPSKPLNPCQIKAVLLPDLSDEEAERVNVLKVQVNGEELMTKDGIQHDQIALPEHTVYVYIFVTGTRHVRTRVQVEVEFMSTTPRAEWPFASTQAG